MVLGVGYCAVAIGVFVAGMLRHREIDRELRGAAYRPLSDALVLVLSVAGVTLTVVTGLIIVFAD